MIVQNLNKTVMDKAEAKKEISQLRKKRQNAIDDARITYLEGFIDGQKELEQYAQQVRQDTIANCKEALLKQLCMMIYKENTYPCEAVPKATILSLDKLITTKTNNDENKNELQN